MFLRKIWWRHGKTTIKPIDDLTQQDIDEIRKVALRAALHKAVDKGLLDDICLPVTAISTPEKR